VSPIVIVRYGELGLKSAPVRREFERTLRRNLLDQFLSAKSDCRIRADHGHLYIESTDAGSAAELGRRVFGVTSVSVAHEIATDVAAISQEVLRLGEGELTPGRRFAIRARRTGQHPFSSQELAAHLGEVVLEHWPERALKVDLTHPEVEVFVEVRGPRTYIYFGRRRGPGGLPLGVAGTVVALVDGPRGALGAFLMMKRGCRAFLVTTSDGEDLARSVLLRFDPKAVIRQLPPDALSSGPMLNEIATGSGADGIVLPLLVDDYPSAREAWGDRVVFSPTVGFTDEEVLARWRSVQELLT
jgi:thiamine biosynthesis protein ThiI